MMQPAQIFQPRSRSQSKLSNSVWAMAGVVKSRGPSFAAFRMVSSRWKESNQDAGLVAKTDAGRQPFRQIVTKYGCSATSQWGNRSRKKRIVGVVSGI